MIYKRLIQGLHNYNETGQLEASSLPWFDYGDFRAFLMRCYHNSIPIYGVDIYQLRAGMIFYVQTLLARAKHYNREGIYYRQWNRHLMDHELDRVLPRLQATVESLSEQMHSGLKLFPRSSLSSAPVCIDMGTNPELDVLCFVPAGDWG